MKEFMLSNMGEVPDRIRNVIEKTKVDDMIYSPLLFRAPWDILLGDISKDNVCVVGDALHPMTPDLGQGACSSLEDAVVLARCLGKALASRSANDQHYKINPEEEEHERIKMGLGEYAKERKWRAVDLISTGYILGALSQSNSKVVNFIRDKVLSRFLFGLILKKASFDCGTLT
ncbi:hypothetical protein Dimus_026167 [Dionaea muscipula]